MKFLLLFFSILLILSGCSPNQIINKPKMDQSQIIKARDHFTEGMFKELEGENEKALVEYYDALLYDTSSFTIYNRIAQNHIVLGRFESALIYLNKSANINPDNIETHRLMATCFYRLNRDQEAIKHLETVLRLDPFDEDSRNMLILLYRKSQNYLGLAEQYENIMNIYGDDENLVRKTSAIYLKNGDNESAKILFIKYLESDSTNSGMWYSLARLYEIDGELNLAIDGYLKSYKYSNDINESVERLHVLYKQREQWQDILSLFTPIVFKDSTNYSAKLAIAEAHYYLENKELAKGELLELQKIKRLQWPVYNLLGRIEFENKNYSLAKNYYQKLIEIDANSRIGWLFLGFIYSDMDSLEIAANHYQMALEQLPDDPYILSFYGLTLNRLGKDQEAIEQLEKALEIDKENINALVTLGLTLNKVDRKKEALIPLKKAISLDPDNINAYTTLGMIYDELKYNAASDSLYEIALTIFPDNDLLLNNYAYSLADRGMRLEFALEMSKKAISIQPENGAYLDTIGWIYFRLKQFNIALDFIKKSLDSREDSPVVIEHLGDVYFELGDHSNAKLYWEKAKDLDPENENLKKKINSI
jgi:tetratricopeptide (TPR) repeat protein